MDTDELVVDAFRQLGIAVRLAGESPGGQHDVVLDPDGVAVTVAVKRRALVTEDVAARLLAEVSDRGVLMLVADRVTDSARRLLTRDRGGYLDLRGRVGVRTDRLVIDAQVERVVERSSRSEALSGQVGLEVATALLMEPGRGFAVRALARMLDRSPSTVSEVLAALRRDGLTDDANTVVGNDLFSQVAERWPSRRTVLATLPVPGDAALGSPLRLGLDDPANPGWALTDSAAAVAYGAPLAFRAGQVLDFFVPDQATLRRATTLLGIAASSAQAQATVRVAPVPAAVQQRVHLDRQATKWPLAHPVFVALDLAQDAGRGKEILDAWNPDERWTRVW